MLARWTGVVALVGCTGFLLTIGTVLDAPSSESAFGLGYPLGSLCLVVVSVTSGLRLSGNAVPSPAAPLPSTR